MRILAPLIAMLIGISTSAANPLPVLRADGTRMVNPSGKPVFLRGCNLGNWLMIEPWMLGGCIEAQDQGQMTDILIERFGEDGGYALMDRYRQNYITPRDFELVKSFGFNVVRIPFDYRLLQDEKPPFAIRPDVFKWLDRALELAEQAGIYVILDMHGVPAGQSNQMHTGRANQPTAVYNDPAAQQRMLDLWSAIAARYKDRSVIAAYDIVNEPYADYKTDVSAPLRQLMFRAYDAVRSSGDEHVILFPATLGKGIQLYGDVRARGLKQFAFTDHFYPGLFGSPSTILSHANTIGRDFPTIQAYLDEQRAPFLAGEFNVVLDRCGGERMMRRYYDEFAQRNWIATMWSYKLLKRAAGVEPDNWYLVTNAEPLPKIDLKRDSKQTIESFMVSMSSLALTVDEPLRHALTVPTSTAFDLPKLPELPAAAPASQEADGWKGIAVNTGASCGIECQNDRLVITAGGGDIFNTADSFYFVRRAIESEQVLLSATVSELVESAVYAKAGVMLRLGRPEVPGYASAPFAMVNVFPDGTVAFVTRDRVGAVAKETKRYPGPLPRRLGLLRHGSRVQGLVDDGAGHWIALGEFSIDPTASSEIQVGLAVCSHQGSLLTRSAFADVKLLQGSAVPPAAQPAAGLNPPQPTSQNLLVNGSFAVAGNDAQATANWNSWGTWTRHVQGESAAMLFRQHDGDSGLWQDVKVTPNAAYRFTITASREGVATPNAGSVELRLEGESDGKWVALASRDFNFEWIEPTPGRSTLSVAGHAISDTMRVLVRVNPSRKAKRGDFELKLDSATFTPAE